jgi:hypothetical protein
MMCLQLQMMLIWHVASCRLSVLLFHEHAVALLTCCVVFNSAWKLDPGLVTELTGELRHSASFTLHDSHSAAAAAAAASVVHYCRTQPENLGQNLAVLRGHTASITLIDFHPKLPSAPLLLLLLLLHCPIHQPEDLTQNVAVLLHKSH